MIDELIQKQVEEYNKVGMCDCECHISSSSDEDMKINGCDLCYENSEYSPRHPDKRNLFVQSMKKVADMLRYELRYCPHCNRMVNSLTEKGEKV